MSDNLMSKLKQEGIIKVVLLRQVCPGDKKDMDEM